MKLFKSYAALVALFVLRDPLSTATLAPGVNTNTFSGDQLTISGGPGYDNLVMVNGVSITEAVRCATA